MKQISSCDVVEDFDCHIKVSAGPGAGKTTWLARQVAYVVRNSTRLHAVSKVLCISYTNIACETLANKISDVRDRVELSTIHSFLFKRVVRPYLHLLLDDDGSPIVAHDAVQGHDEPNPTFYWINRWLDHIEYSKKTPQLREVKAKDTAFVKYLTKLRWRLKKDGTWGLSSPGCRPPQWFPASRLRDYKELLWRKGVIEHDDVLYFAYCILEKHPQLRVHLAARYPYVFIDEFQDTDPRQTQVVRWMAENSGSWVCVIGDAAQSIFRFAGARMEDFVKFTLPGMEDLKMIDNRRSTQSIVSFLNSVRPDGLTQTPARLDSGDPVTLVVGERERALSSVLERIDSIDTFAVLTRRNEDVAQLRSLLSRSNGAAGLWMEFAEVDNERCLLFRALLDGLVLVRAGSPGLGVTVFLDGFRVRDGKHRLIRGVDYITRSLRKGIATTFLACLGADFDSLRRQSLITVYSELSASLGRLSDGASLKGIRSGKLKTFAQENTLNDLISTLDLSQELSEVRTIHKAKGDEFNVVAVFLTEEKQLNDIFAREPILEEENEEPRIMYVALSRARDRLSIVVPTLSGEMESTISGLNRHVRVLRLSDV